MSDERIRAMERSEDPAVRKKLLLERLRSGEVKGLDCPSCDSGVVRLISAKSFAKAAYEQCKVCSGSGLTDPMEAVKLAAYLHDESALAVLGRYGYEFRWCESCGASDLDSGCWSSDTGRHYCGRCSHGLDPEYDVEIKWNGLPMPGDFAQGLERWGREVVARASIAAARESLTRWAILKAETDTIPNEELAFAKQVAFRKQAPLRVIEAAEDWVTNQTIDMAAKWDREHRYLWPGHSGHDMLIVSHLGLKNYHGPSRISYCAELIDFKRVYAAIARDIIPWALGYGDPAKERQASRAKV